MKRRWVTQSRKHLWHSEAGCILFRLTPLRHVADEKQVRTRPCGDHEKLERHEKDSGCFRTFPGGPAGCPTLLIDQIGRQMSGLARRQGEKTLWSSKEKTRTSFHRRPCFKCLGIRRDFECRTAGSSSTDFLLERNEELCNRDV